TRFSRDWSSDVCSSDLGRHHHAATCSRSDDEFAPADPLFQLLKTEAICLPARQSVQTDPVLAACKHKVQRHQNVIHQRLAVPEGLHSDTAFPVPDTVHHSACCI